jgi:hypothetical protein
MQARRSNDASALVDLLAVVRDGLGGARVPRRGGRNRHDGAARARSQTDRRLAGGPDGRGEMGDGSGVRRAFRESADNTSSVTVSACRAAGAGLANLVGGR